MLNQSLRRFQISDRPVAWQFSDYRVSRLNSRFNDSLGDLMTFLQLTLPGAVEIYYGQEIGMKDAEKTTRRYTGLMQWDASEKAGFTAETDLDLFFGLTADWQTVNYKVIFSC